MALYIPSIKAATQRIIKAYIVEDYSTIKETMDYVLNTATIAGNEDDYHNCSVNLVEIDDYYNAVLLLKHGLKRYPKSTDILADLLLYGLKCGKISEISPFYYNGLADVDKKFWSWRAFHFSIEFLMIYIQYAENDEQQDAITDEIKTLIADYKRYRPTDERAYMVEHDFYKLINQENNAENSLKMALDSLKLCPQCALNYADNLFAKGEYAKSIPILERTIKMAENQPSINIGYAYYILALSKESVLRNSGNDFNSDNIKPIYNAYYSALEFLDDNMIHLREQCVKKVSILERESGIKSDIA